ncbi:DUF99 family protein [Halohasta salina]|uniref:endonuclease dU n=1 Tax=Halohasta salina TaxID=2961621 RepID=UPI0020A250CC|nr:DUF99 family protein [Halohasta salina]
MAPKAGSRALGIAASDATDRSRLSGAVVRADRVVDDLVFASCTIGGSDATAACGRLWDRLDRPDVQWLLLAGVAPAWFNLVDLDALADHTDRPVIAVAFEDSDGLEAPLREQFDGDALDTRLDVYRRLPPRTRVSVGDESVFVRAVGVDTDVAADVVRAFTLEGSGRPEPLRVARLAARAGREWLDGVEQAEDRPENTEG